MILDNTNLKENNYISNILDSSWLSPVNIQSMVEILSLQELIPSFSIEKLLWVLKGVSIQDFTNIIQDFSYFVYLFHG